MSVGMNRRPLRPLRPVASPPAPAGPDQLPASEYVRWFKPDQDLTDELVVSGATGRAITQLARELRHTDDFLRAGLEPATRVLFGGPSGTGKTLAARWIGWMLRLPVAVIDISTAIGMFVGESSRNLGECFRVAASVPSVLFLDEVDAICMRRDLGSQTSAGAEMARSTTVFLQQVDWVRPSRVIIAATNFADQLDSALRRRLTTEIAFELPDRETRARMLARWFEREPLGDELVTALLDATEGMSGADLRSRAMVHARARLIERLPPPAAEPPPPPQKTVTELAQELLFNLEAMGAKR